MVQMRIFPQNPLGRGETSTPSSVRVLMAKQEILTSGLAYFQKTLLKVL
jgi:hypothetical protein